MTTFTLNPALPILLTMKEAASVLRIHRATLYLMVNDGRARSVRFGGAIRITTDEVARLAANGCGGPNKHNPKPQQLTGVSDG